MLRDGAILDFDAPLGVVGRLVEWAGLRRYMLGLIVKRGAYLEAEAERPGSSPDQT